MSGSAEEAAPSWTRGRIPGDAGAGARHLEVVALATLEKGRRMPLQKPAGKHTLMRVDFDGDGAADAELVSMPNEIGCDQRFEQPELQVRAEGARVRASCCGP